MYLHKVTKPNAVIFVRGIAKRLNVGELVERETEKIICGDRSEVVKKPEEQKPLELEVATPKRSARKTTAKK